MDFKLTPDAQMDLREIRRFTQERWGENQSKKYLSDLRDTIRVLVKNSSLGKPRLDVGDNVHSFPHDSHVIYYLTHEEGIIVFGILHKRMIPANHLKDRGI